MERASYRHRPDGVLQIVRPHPLRRHGRALRSAAAAVLLFLAGACGVLIEGARAVLSLLLVAAGIAFSAVVLRRSVHRRLEAPPPPAGIRRIAT